MGVVYHKSTKLPKTLREIGGGRCYTRYYSDYTERNVLQKAVDGLQKGSDAVKDCRIHYHFSSATQRRFL